MSTDLKSSYDAAFYANQKAGSLTSAAIVLERLKPALGAVRSALDVGCGAGGWLKAAGDAFPGLDVFGVDHPDVPKSEMFIPTENFRGADLSAPIDLERRFDLVISLEVAEHIAPDRAEAFIDTLARHGDRILFSAAIPRQGGTGHVNEQWPDYWAKLFDARGFEAFDIVRPMIWYEDAVASWYKQNVILYARGDARPARDGHEDWGARAMVHPGSWIRGTEPLASKISRALRGEKPSHQWR